MVTVGRVYPESVHCSAWVLRGLKRIGAAIDREASTLEEPIEGRGTMREEGL